MIASADQLRRLCERLAGADRIGVDTEFLTGDTFRPKLCLIQVAADGILAVIDPLQTGDVREFWGMLADGNHVTIMHAAREELNFALAACGRAPASLFDTQLAAALCSVEFQAPFSSVVHRFLGIRPEKGEQRTDWSQRPLRPEQIEYALEDVRYLLALHEAMHGRLEELNRVTWLAEEMERWLADVLDARARPQWWRVAGASNLSPRSLAIVRELSMWRMQQAERRDIPLRRVLRDDLLVELAKRKSDSVESIRDVHGMSGMRPDVVAQLAACVRRGLEASLEDIERQAPEAMRSQLNLLGQFLSPALASICRKANVATGLAGSATDVRDLIASRLGLGNGEEQGPPLLATGWRAELIGHLIEELLAGKRSIRIEAPLSEHPLAFDPVDT